jgi:UDP:flavonoid glycosyltransferase YjiC (YdhE family)
MATRKLVLGSAATLLFSGAMIAAAPVLAQSSSDPAQAYSTAKAQYDAELQDYNQKQQAYERQRSEYNAKIEGYQRSLNAAPDTVVVVDDPAPDVVVVDRDPATVVVADANPDVVVVRDDFAQRLAIRNVPPLVRLEDVAGANYELFNMPVLDSAGLPVGHFRRLETKAPGDLVAVVTLNGSRRTISLLTEHVRFDPDRRTIIADMPARAIDRIPSGFPYG